MANDETINAALENRNFVQAVSLGKNQGLPQDDIGEWQRQALWEAAAVFRNIFAVKILATRYGFSKDQVRELLEDRAGSVTEGSGDKATRPRYDYITNRHLDLSQWMDQLFSAWKKLPG